jgi:hypothetical protein
MHTIMLKSQPRSRSTGTVWMLETIGDSPVKDAIRESIRTLEHHPAKAQRRSMIDALAVIEKHNFKIVFAEKFDDEGNEGWTFILQG